MRSHIPGYVHAIFMGVTARRMLAGFPAPHVDTPIEELEAEYRRAEPEPTHHASASARMPEPAPALAVEPSAEPLVHDAPRAEVGSFEPPPPAPSPPPLQPSPPRAPSKRPTARPQTAPAQPGLFDTRRT